MSRRVFWGGILLGIGLGGFFDGIVFHQLLQWHHMLSSTKRWPTTTTAGLKANTLADGIFHAAMLLVVFAAVLLIRSRTPSRHVLYGLLLAGWGGFNLLEGLVDHELLGIHHVRGGADHRTYDLVFLAVAVLQVLAGWWAVNAKGERRAEPQAS